MKEKTSQKLLLIEMIFLALPVTILFLYGGFMMLLAFFRLGTEYGAITTFGPLIVALCSLVSLYILSYKYIFSGHEALNNVSYLFWVFLYAGSIYSVFGIASIVAMAYQINDYLFIFSFFRLGVFGLVLLPPVIHLFMVNKNKTANK